MVQYDHAAHTLTATLPGGTATITADKVTSNAPSTICTGSFEKAFQAPATNGTASSAVSPAPIPEGENLFAKILRESHANSATVESADATIDNSQPNPYAKPFTNTFTGSFEKAFQAPATNGTASSTVSPAPIPEGENRG